MSHWPLLTEEQYALLDGIERDLADGAQEITRDQAYGLLAIINDMAAIEELRERHRVFDEVDRYPGSTDDERASVEIAQRALLTFGRRKEKGPMESTTTRKRFYPQLVNVKRGESPWCRGEENRVHVMKPEPETDGRMLCKRCGVCVGRWAEDNGQLNPDNRTVTMTRKELRELIAKYAGSHGPEHHADCRTMHNALGEGPCTCGYADIFDIFGGEQ